jgi:integrase
LFRRKDSPNLYVRLQPPGQKIIEHSLGTSDVAAAELAALDLIKKHKQLMYQRRSIRTVRRTVTTFWDSTHRQFGLQVIDGRQVFVTEREIRDPETGAFIGPNGGPAELLSPAPRNVSFEAYDDAKRVTAPPTKGSDDDLLETYLKQNGISGLPERQARDIWHVFKTVVNKPLKQCGRKDGRAIVTYLKKQYLEKHPGEEIKSATLRRRMVPLVATVNLAIAEDELKFNPFSSVVPVRDDEDERDAFTEDDIALMRANLHKLDKNDQLLVRLLATTGMRRGEAFEIDREQIEDGIRFVTIGTKTPQSRRRVPFAADLLPYLPEKISGQLITGRMDSAGKRLSKWMIEIGIAGITNPDSADEDKTPGELDKAVMHSFRHRAAQRLRAAIPDESLREAVGGWANGKTKKSSRKYGNKHGKGFPLSKLKEAIDVIGF